MDMKTIALPFLLFCFLTQTHAQKVQTADACESAAGWTGGQPVTVVESDVKQGKYALQCEGEAPYRFRKLFSPAVNSGLSSDAGYLSFWLFISDVSDLTTSPGLVQIGSAARSELNAHHWQLKNLNLKNGWNKVVLQLSPASAKGGAFDPASFMYFALIQKTTKPVVFKLDDIRFANDVKDL
jgi:hypothetical protein